MKHPKKPRRAPRRDHARRVERYPDHANGWPIATGGAELDDRQECRR